MQLNFKENLPVILTSTLLIVVTGVLFWYGTKVVTEANDIQSTVIAFENLQQPKLKTFNSLNKDTSSDINFFIKNIEPKKITYEITFLLNEQVIDSKKIPISSKHTELLEPTEIVLTKLIELSKTQSEILYQVKISWNSNTEIIGKWIK